MELPRLEAELTRSDSAAIEGETQSLPLPRQDSLLLHWALYFSRFDPLAAMASEFEQER